jgi:ssDNA-binding Zn-finger/Zn-ribbon topoisomerase 1
MNNQYLYEVSCFDCMNCSYNNYQDAYCESSCNKCYAIYPQMFTVNNQMMPQSVWYNPSQYPYGHYYGSYITPSIMY